MKKKEVIWGIVGLMIFAIMFILVFRMYIAEGQNKVVDYTKLPEDMVNYLNLDMSVIAMDPVKRDMTLRIFFTPIGKFIDSNELLTKKLYFYMNAVDRQEFVFQKGREVTPMEITLNAYGMVTEYPFDTYEIPFFCEAEILDKKDTAFDAKDQVIDNVPIQIKFEGSLHGYDITAEIDTSSTVTYSGIDITVERAGSTKFFSVFIMVAMWLLSGIVIFLILSIVVRKRKIELPMFTFISAMIFALPALRNMQPLVPSIGTFSDYVSFFWAESFMALCLFVIVFVWLRRPGEKHEG